MINTSAQCKTDTTTMRLALLALAAAAPAAVLGVHHFKELNSRDDLQYLNMVAPDCKSPSHTCTHT